MQQQLKCAQIEAHRWQREYIDATGVLTSRLRELAEFLDSLLKQKSVINLMATDRRRAMRNAIDKSLDLSKTIANLSQTINDTINISNFTINESFLLSENKENIQNSLSASVLLGAVNTESSLLSNTKSRATDGKTSIGGAVSTTTSATTKKDRKIIIDPNSESEAWSEPDRMVSSARIGLEDSTKLLSANNTKCSLTNRSTNSLELDSLNSTTDDDVNNAIKKNMSKNSLLLQERIDELQLQISERDNRILESQCQLVDIDNKYHTERLKLLELTKELDCYKNANDQLELEIAQTKLTNENYSNDIERLQIELDKSIENVKQLIGEKDAMAIDLRVSMMKQSALEADMNDIKMKHSTQITDLQVQNKADIDKLHADHEIEMTRQRFEHKNELIHNYISLDVYEKQQKTLSDAEHQIDLLKDTEAELNAQIQRIEKEMRTLRQNLDETTLQASKTVVDRHKVMSELQFFEKKCSELVDKLDIANKMNGMYQTRLDQLASKENLIATSSSSTSLALKLSPSSLKTEKYQLSKSASHGNARYMMSQFNTDLSPSEYTSADEMKYRFDNSSPDLGIDSDAGRTSGSERHHKLNAFKVVESNNNGKLVLEI